MGQPEGSALEAPLCIALFNFLCNPIGQTLLSYLCRSARQKNTCDPEKVAQALARKTKIGMRGRDKRWRMSLVHGRHRRNGSTVFSMGSTAVLHHRKVYSPLGKSVTSEGIRTSWISADI